MQKVLRRKEMEDILKRLRVEAMVIGCKESMYRKGVYYVTVEAKSWGTFSYVSKQKRREGDRVVLQDQKLRASRDMIRWEEVK